MQVHQAGDDGGLKITNHAVTDWKLYIIQEFCDAGSLRQAVIKRVLFSEERKVPRMVSGCLLA